MASTDLQVTFSGPAVESGAMDVRLLAPSLIALGEAHQAAHRELHPDDPPVTLHVTATERGSFSVQMEVVQNVWEQVRSMFTNDDASALANLTGILAFLIQLLKWLYGKTGLRRSTNPDGTITITDASGDSITVTGDVIKILESQECRRALKDFTDIFEHEGIESVSLTPDGGQPATISRGEATAFAMPPVPEELLSEVTSEQHLTLASVAFIEGNKWRLSDGERTFHATIEDESFLDRVNRDAVRFARHDILRAKITAKYWRTQNGLRTEYTVDEVIEHIAASRPLRLPLFDQDDDGES